MRKIALVSLFIILAMGLSSLLPYRTPKALATPPPYNVTDCIAAGQGPKCANTLFFEVGSTNVQYWDPAHEWDPFGLSILGLLYDSPVEFNSPTISLSSLAPTSAIAAIDVANGSYYQFTIRTGIHAWRLNSTTPVDLGEITAYDWVFSIERAIGECASDGPAPSMYQTVYNSSNWLTTCVNNYNNGGNPLLLQKPWDDWLHSTPTPIGVINSTTWYVRVDADKNASDGLQPYAGFLSILANPWAGVYPKSVVEDLCGPLYSHLASPCTGTDLSPGFSTNKIAIGTGPYLLDELASN